MSDEPNLAHPLAVLDQSKAEIDGCIDSWAQAARQQLAAGADPILAWSSMLSRLTDDNASGETVRWYLAAAIIQLAQQPRGHQ